MTHYNSSLRNRANSTALGKVFGPIFFFGSEDVRPENAFTFSVTHTMISECKKLLESTRENTLGTDNDNQEGNGATMPQSAGSSESSPMSSSANIATKSGPLILRKDNMMWKEIYGSLIGNKLVWYSNRRVFICCIGNLIWQVFNCLGWNRYFSCQHQIRCKSQQEIRIWSGQSGLQCHEWDGQALMAEGIWSNIQVFARNQEF